MSLNAQDSTDLAPAVANLFKQNYLEKSIADSIYIAIMSNYERGFYARLDSIDLAEAIKATIDSVVIDRHISVHYDPKFAQRLNNRGGIISARNSAAKDHCYGFEEFTLLKGNVGYIKLSGFYNGNEAKQMLDSVMLQLKNSTSMIIDVRHNSGGVSQMVSNIISYFVRDSILFHQFYIRPFNRTTSNWTSPSSAKFIVDKIPVYILTSKKSFSSAEMLAFCMKYMGRAKIVGEPTGGAAHAANVFTLQNKYVIFVPHGKPISPFTDKNWEGIGVIPDIEVSPDQALEYVISEITKIDRSR